MAKRKLKRVNVADEGGLNENDAAINGQLEDASTYTIDTILVVSGHVHPGCPSSRVQRDTRRHMASVH